MNIPSIKRALKCYVMVVCHATCFSETFQDGCVSPWPDPPGAQFGHTPPKWWYVSVWFTDTHWTSGAVRHQLGSGVTKVVLRGICSAALRHPVLALTPNNSRTLCASGCSRGKCELQTVNVSYVDTPDVVFLCTLVLLGDIWSNMDSSDLHKSAVDKTLRWGLDANVPVIPFKAKWHLRIFRLSELFHPFPIVTSAFLLSMWKECVDPLHTVCSEFIRVIVFVRDHLCITFFLAWCHFLTHLSTRCDKNKKQLLLRKISRKLNESSLPTPRRLGAGRQQHADLDSSQLAAAHQAFWTVFVAKEPTAWVPRTALPPCWHRFPAPAAVPVWCPAEDRLPEGELRLLIQSGAPLLSFSTAGVVIYDTLCVFIFKRSSSTHQVWDWILWWKSSRSSLWSIWR